MKPLLIISLLGAGLLGLASCKAKVEMPGTPVEEKKETTIVNPPAEKKVETNTTIVNPPAGDKK